jgi:hypothetical protein
MTAYLSPGDKIHLALPIDGTIGPDKARENFLADQELLKGLYGAMGVTIEVWSGHTSLAVPTVVSVIQAERKLL